MKVFNLKNYKKGWVMGNFTPTLYNTNTLEIKVQRYKKGYSSKKHYHKIAKEYTIIMSGSFRINNQTFNQNDIVLIEKNEITNFECLEEGDAITIKTPSISNDKYLVN